METPAEIDPQHHIDTLRREIAQATSGRVRLRLLMNLHLSEGMDAQEVAELLAVGRTTVFHWQRRYREGGVEALSNRPRSGRPPALTAEQVGRLRRLVLAGPTEADGALSRWRGEDIRRLIAREFGVEMSLNGVYLNLHRMELSWLCPRPLHPKGNEQAQTRFREETAPLLSGKRRKSTRTK